MAETRRPTEVLLEDLAADDAFQSWGYAHLKVTHGEKLLSVKVRVSSVPQDVIDEMRKKTPRPPAKTTTIEPGTDDARRMNVTTRTRAIVPDFTNEKYQEDLEAHNLWFTQRVVGHGVTAPLTLKDGSPAATPEQKYRALQDRGLSGSHFAELAQEILRLTDWSESERESFFGNASA